MASEILPLELTVLGACAFQATRFNRHTRETLTFTLDVARYTRAVSKPTACVRFSAATKSYKTGLVHTS